MSERERIVAWLRREAANIGNRGLFDMDDDTEDAAARDALVVAALRIERGEHMERPEPTIPFEDWRDVPSVG